MKPVNDRLHIWIVWSVTALWRYPCDILTWVLDIACFTVHTVLPVDLEARAVSVFNDFIDPRRAVTLGWFGVLWQVYDYRN